MSVCFLMTVSRNVPYLSSRTDDCVEKRHCMTVSRNCCACVSGSGSVAVVGSVSVSVSVSVWVCVSVSVSFSVSVSVLVTVSVSVSVSFCDLNPPPPFHGLPNPLASLGPPAGYCSPHNRIITCVCVVCARSHTHRCKRAYTHTHTHTYTHTHTHTQVGCNLGRTAEFTSKILHGVRVLARPSYLPSESSPVRVIHVRVTP